MTDTAWRMLVEDFVAERLDGPAFERRFLDQWRADRDAGLSNSYAIETLFGGVDAFCADPALFGPHDITEAQLREEARQALENWDRPWPELPRWIADGRRDDDPIEAVREAAAKLWNKEDQP